MTEKRKSNTIREINFLGQSLNIDVLKPPKSILIGDHKIVDNYGKVTQYTCPCHTGLVSVSEVIGDEKVTHRVIVCCESATKPFALTGGWAQCRNSVSSFVKI